MSVKLFLRLLVALAILFVVAAVLFPIFVPNPGKPPRISCASNEKQLGLAIMQYVQDNDEMMPNVYVNSPNNSWRVLIYPYVKSQGVYQCLSRDRNATEATAVGADAFPTSYAANYTGNYGRTQPDQGRGAFAGPGSQPVAIARVPNPAGLIMLTEAADNPFPQFNIDDAHNYSPASRRLWAGHQGYGNYLMFDGHVKWMKPLTTYQVTSGQVIQNLWYRDGTQPLSANGVAVLQDAQQRFKP